jgi:hypothetical protein
VNISAPQRKVAQIADVQDQLTELFERAQNLGLHGQIKCTIRGYHMQGLHISDLAKPCGQSPGKLQGLLLPHPHLTSLIRTCLDTMVETR